MADRTETHDHISEDAYPELAEHIDRVQWSGNGVSWADDGPECGTTTMRFVAQLEMAPRRVDALNRKFYKLRGTLDAAWSSVISDDVYVSDDACGDVLSHVIGLGFGEVRRALERPDTLTERYDGGEYAEGFQYTLPNTRAMGQVTRKHYRMLAQRYHLALSLYRQGGDAPGRTDTPYEDLSREAMNRVMWLIDALPRLESAPVYVDQSDREWRQRIVSAEAILRDAGVARGHGMEHMISAYESMLRARERVLG